MYSLKVHIVQYLNHNVVTAANSALPFFTLSGSGEPVKGITASSSLFNIHKIIPLLLNTNQQYCNQL